MATQAARIGIIPQCGVPIITYVTVEISEGNLLWPSEVTYKGMRFIFSSVTKKSSAIYVQERYKLVETPSPDFQSIVKKQAIIITELEDLIASQTKLLRTLQSKLSNYENLR